MDNPKQHFNVCNPISQHIWVDLILSPQVHFQENYHSPDTPNPEDSTQAMVHECLIDGGIDLSDIYTVM